MDGIFKPVASWSIIYDQHFNEAANIGIYSVTFGQNIGQIL